MLPEERLAVEAVEADAVGDLDEVELGFLREDCFDVRFEEGVRLEDFGAYGSLNTTFYFGFGPSGEAGDLSQRGSE